MADYWGERLARSQARLTKKSITATEKQLAKYYNNVQKRVIADFEATYDKILKAQTDGRLPTPADLYKLDKYWQMQAQVRAELNRLGDKQLSLFSKSFIKQYNDIYNSIAIPSKSAYSTISQEGVTQMIRQIWCADGKSWSDRVWHNTELLQEALNEGLLECLVTGKQTSELKKLLQARFSVSYNRADSIVRTEMAHIQTQAAKQRYTDYGVQYVEVLADEDERRCKVCGKLHGTRHPVNGSMPVPAHPKCRCCIIPVVN